MFFDAHTHLQFAAFGGDYKEAARRALDAGAGIINVGTQKDTSVAAVALAREFENEPVFAAVGLHPIHTEKSYYDEKELGGSSPKEFSANGENFDYDYYKKLASDPKVVAIGECGLDYYRLEEGVDREARIAKQKAAFDGQIKLSVEIEKPLMIHCRDSTSSPQTRAFADLIKILKANNSKLKAKNPGVIHFFSGTKEDADRLMDLGFSFTFGGAITFPSRKNKTVSYEEIIKYLPLDRILSETDAPYVAPVPYRGKRNEPAYVVEVVKKLAEIKNISVEEMAEKIWENARRVFNLT